MSQLPPSPPPLPVEPLTYSTPLTTGRPGIITAIGVISIIVAALGGLAALVSGLETAGFYSLSRSPLGARTSTVTTVTVNGRTTMFGASSPSASPSPWPPVPAEQVAPRGLNQRDRWMVIAGLSRVRRLTAPRRQQLAALLADAGRDIVPLPGSALTAQDVRANVSASGQVPDFPSGQAADYFVLGGGTLYVGDDHAVFRPTDGSPALRSASPALTTGMPASSPPRALASPFGKVSLAAVVLLMVQTLLSLILAVYLCIIGILVLRQSPRGAWLHRVYALAKIPLAIAGGIAQVWVFSGYMGRMPNSAAAVAVIAVMAAFWVMVGCIYPVALLIALSMRTVRDYYNQALVPW